MKKSVTFQKYYRLNPNLKLKKKKKNRQKQNNIMSPTNLSLKANSLWGERRETATRLITPLEKPLY